MIIHDDEIEIEIEEEASATSDKNSHQSVFREKLLEHIFVSELLKYAWRNDNFTLEIARAEIDRCGYDLIVEANGSIRHIQLKSRSKLASAREYKINQKLAEKPAGCVICIVFDDSTTAIDEYWFYGGKPNERLVIPAGAKTAKHTRGNKDGVKGERTDHKKVSKSKFIRGIKDIDGVYRLLFAAD